MLDSKFWERYFKIYDVLNLLIPYQELLETICDELGIKPNKRRGKLEPLFISQ